MKTIFRNGRIYHGRHVFNFDACSCMVIEGAKIEYLGNESGAHLRIGSELSRATVVDLGGRSVFPSFIDGHMHFLQFGASLVKVGLDHCKNLEDIRSTIAQAAKDRPDAKRILCRGWRQLSTNRQALTTMIDDIDPRPIFIDADDLHSEWCNSAALADMGITRATPDPAGGTIQRDENGDATGLISEGAVITLVWPHLIDCMSREDKLNAMRAAVQAYHASGYTGVIEMAMDKGSWELLEHLQRNGQLRLRVAAHWIIIPTGNDAANLVQVQDAIDLHERYNIDSSPDLRIAGIKVICDGVVDSCTAALSTPYLVPPHGTGDMIWTPAALQKVASKADVAHLQVALHAIGDAAINSAINVLEGLASVGRRHRIEHLELTHPNDAKRLGKLGITASIQPVHSDPSILGAWPELIGPERCDWAFAHQDFHDHGAQLAIGTDSPTAPHLPLPNLYVAHTRLSARDLHGHRKVNQRSGMELYSAWSAATWGSAYSCFAEGTTGSLEIGKSADFIVIDGLSSEPDAQSLLTAKVVQTWMDGQLVYEA